ncbi:hypothetical protein HYH02_011489 [Chlamydomonas schloesseri]|uniref:TauD/TfdA-like domain-containing protein n=1 Tax=Chlamydomonas schloesseri TaxID=2026947 RepID=A0A835T099_9CHLO|nr:hypothetical protein HYH02_011489 [Chlamydomonas schloesseri]|eukprot:KAG2436552.1 hypothetical protein HYH02_011489 [Chlamydomonas schloesseri]
MNAKDHLIGHIKDLGRDPAGPNIRLYATNAAQPWHNDDLVGLLCLSDGAEGGESGWSSSVSVHNEILRTAPHLAHVLADSWFFDRKGEVPAGKKPFFEIPCHELACADVTVDTASTAVPGPGLYEKGHALLPPSNPAHPNTSRKATSR